MFPFWWETFVQVFDDNQNPNHTWLNIRNVLSVVESQLESNERTKWVKNEDNHRTNWRGVFNVYWSKEKWERETESLIRIDQSSENVVCSGKWSLANLFTLSNLVFRITAIRNREKSNLDSYSSNLSLDDCI